MDTGWRKSYLRYKSFFLNMLTQYRERSDWKAYLEILLSLVTVSIFSIFALKPTVLTIAELIREIEEKKEAVSKMDSKIQSLSKAQSLYDRQRSNILLLTESTIPKTSNSDIIARQIEGLSSGNQVGISLFTLGRSIVFGSEVIKDEGKEQPETQTVNSELHYSVTGEVDIDDYLKSLNFLREFEGLRPPPIIDTLEFSVNEEKENKSRSITVLIDGELLYLVEKSDSETGLNTQ